MLLRLIVRFSRKLTVASFLVAVFLTWVVPTAFAEVVRVTLVIKVTDESGRPVSKAQIRIPRQAQSDPKLKLNDIKDLTDNAGQYQRPATDFDLTGTAHRVIITAGDLTGEFELSDQQLRDAVSKRKGVLMLQFSVKPPNKQQRVHITGTVTDLVGKAINEAEISLSVRNTSPESPSFESTVKSGADGRFQLQNVEFEPGDLPRILKISATGFEDFQLDLANETLVKNSNNILQLNPVILKIRPSLIEQTRNALNWFLWNVGLVTVLVLVIVLVRRTRRWWTQRKNTDINQQAELSTEELTKHIFKDLKELKHSMLTEAKLVPILTRSLNAWSEKQDPQNSNKEKGNNTQFAGGDIPPAHESYQSTVPQNELILDFKCRAQQAHQNLINKVPDDLEPVYLDVEGPRTAAGKLEDKTVYLKQVNHSNGALVLFTENNHAAWLFPNPKLAFSRTALKDVFLDLSETDYQARKSELEPMPAVRVDDGRWKLASS